MKCRWRARRHPELEKEVVLPLKPFELLAPCKARLLWACAVAEFFFARCSLQFAKSGSAAMLPQQEKNNSADEQRSRVNINAFSVQCQIYPGGNGPSAS
jgi:hypothetical protein